MSDTYYNSKHKAEGSRTVGGVTYFGIEDILDGAVLSNNVQSLSLAEKARARDNIGAYQRPSGGIPKSDLNSDVQATLDNCDSAYQKPIGGIPKTDLSQAVQTSLGKADTALQEHQSLAGYRTAADQDVIDEGQNSAIAQKYVKPSGGIPKTDLASSVQTSLGKADTALQASQKGAENGVASLDSSGKVPIGQLPVDSALSGSSTNPLQNKVVTAALDGKAPVIYDTASGAVASFPDGADNLPVKSLVVQIEPVQSGSGDPSPTNIRPISGWTGCNISHSGEDTSDPDTITATWQDEAGTVYYGTIDIISGVLSALAAMFDMGDLTYTETTSGIRFDISGGVGSGIQGSPAAFAMCSAYKLYADTIQTISQITLPDNCIVQTTASGARARYYIRDDRYTTAAAMKAGLSGVQFLCEMREPITYQLTPQQVNTLIGVNNIWADCGPVAVEYPADTKLYVQKINTPSDDDMTADTQIASGKYFIVGGTLYLSTTTIPAGDAIIPGTNCVATNLAEALNALNA